MDPTRIAFVFDRALEPDELRPDDELQLEQHVRRTFPDLDDEQLLPRSILARMILDNDPPVVWETVERLQKLDMERTRIWGELAIAVLVVLQEVVAEDNAGHLNERLRERLEQLPTPTLGELDLAIFSTIGDRVDLTTHGLGDEVRRRLGFAESDPADIIYERVLDNLLDDGELTFIGDGVIVDPIRLTAASVFTHRLTEIELSSGVLPLGADLGIFAALDHVHLDDHDEGDVAEATIVVDDAGHTNEAWEGPDGWLDGFAVNTLLLMHVAPAMPDDCNHRLVIEAIDNPTVVTDDESLIESLRTIAAREMEDSGLPVPMDDLVCSVIAEHPDAFSTARRPLFELCDAAGLDVRGSRVATGDEPWFGESMLQRTGRLLGLLEDDEPLVLRVEQVLSVMDVVAGADPSWIPGFEGDVDDDRLRETLHDLEDPELLRAVAQEVFLEPPPVVESPGLLGTLGSSAAIITALTSAAHTGGERMVAHWLAAIDAERSGDPLAAEQHLEIAHAADPSNPLPVDHLGWCAFDRGDADRAERLWSRLKPTETIKQDLREVADARRLRGPQPRRNEPCWCGSGRKYKQCHNGHASLPSLPDRIGWLCRKASTFLERRGSATSQMVFAMAQSRALDPNDRDSLIEAFSDPIVIDLVLTEGEWFERFLDERGALLPDDELLLAHSWTLVDRSVFEVLTVQPGSGMSLRDLRSGEEILVRERMLSTQVSPGMLCCARPVPDGETHQFVGGIFGVRVGEEARVLDLCDAGEPFAIARWVADSHRPPTISNREGEEMVQCRVVLAVRDAAAARRVLDRTFEPDESPGGGLDHWIDLADVDGHGEEFIIRATIRLDGNEIHAETNSERRIERVLNIVTSKLRSATVVRDERTPMDTEGFLNEAKATQRADALVGPILHSLEDPRAITAMEQVRDRYEEQWCDESVPALGGVTPREAAADPTRRESLERLIRSFEAKPDIGGPAMRPARLRELLGLTS